MTENEFAAIVVDTSLDIHRRLGPDPLESVYEAVLAFELGKWGLAVEWQVPIPLIWEGMIVSESYRADMIVEKKLIESIKHPYESRAHIPFGFALL